MQSIDADGAYFFGPGPATDWNVFIYIDSSATLPGTQIFSALNQPVSQVGTTFTVNLPVPAVLTAGTYWIEIQANMTFTPQGEWEWTDRMMQANSGAALRNPGGDVGCGTDWIRKIFCVASMDPDQVFRLNGTIGGPSPTPTPTGTPTPTPTPSGCSWSAGPDMPTVLVRAVGVYFPTDGNFYTMGGRTSDAAGSDFQHVLRYTPSTNSWSQMGVTLPDNQMNNMACGVLTVSGTPYIYCVGGSAAGQTTATARVFFYNPVTDTVTTLTSADNWPGDAVGNILPGGFAVTGNKLYILGGFQINVASTNQIWQFDPTGAVGAKWLQRVNTPVGIMYAPTASINGLIFVGGASDFQGGLVIDTTNSFGFDPAVNLIFPIPPIPRATGETRALTYNDGTGAKMLVMGGGRVAPNPSNQVNIFEPGTNSWTTGTRSLRL